MAALHCARPAPEGRHACTFQHLQRAPRQRRCGAAVATGHRWRGCGVQRVEIAGPVYSVDVVGRRPSASLSRPCRSVRTALRTCAWHCKRILRTHCEHERRHTPHRGIRARPGGHGAQGVHAAANGGHARHVLRRPTAISRFAPTRAMLASTRRCLSRPGIAMRRPIRICSGIRGRRSHRLARRKSSISPCRVLLLARGRDRQSQLRRDRAGCRRDPFHLPRRGLQPRHARTRV